MKELTVGIGSSNVKSGILKVASSNKQITKYEHLCCEAAAMAQKATGVPIISHTEASTMGPEMADFLISKGADIKKTMIGHMCDTDDFDYIEAVLQRGVYIGLDRFGLDAIFPDEKKCRNLVKLVEKGYIHKILMGHDCIIYSHAMNILPPGLPHWNLNGIFGFFNPLLKELGLTDAQLKTIQVDNPRRFFEGE